jgi:enoyl-CoA hydratase/carnithine racemase
MRRMLEERYPHLENKLLESIGKSAVGDCALDYRVTDDNVAVVLLGGGDEGLERPWGTKMEEHRLEPHLVLGLLHALDRAQNDPAIKALVVTADGRFFCNGFDLKWIQAHLDLADALQQAVELLYAIILQFPKPTLAAVNGHACAGGAMLMLAFDFRIMNAEKGFVFVPGIDLGIVYTPGMSALMASKLPQQLHRDFIIYGQRFTATMLSQHGVVELASPHELLAQTIQRACDLRSKAKHGATMASIKRTLYHEAISALEHQADDFMLSQTTCTPMGFHNIPVGTDRPSTSAADLPSSPQQSTAPRPTSDDSLRSVRSLARSTASGASSLEDVRNEMHVVVRNERIAGLQRAASFGIGSVQGAAH